MFIKNILIYLLFFTLALHAKGMSFMQAWGEVVSNSDALKAKKENLKVAQFKQSAAKDLYWPSISLSATYTHLDEPIEMSMGDVGLNIDKNSLGIIIDSIAKSSASAAYSEAISAGKNAQEASQIAQQTVQSVVSSFQKINSDLQSSSTKLSNQDIFLSSVRAIWPIFTGGRIKAAQIVAKGEIKEAYAVFEMAKQGEFEDLSHIYFGVVLANEVTKTKVEVKNALKKHYEHSQKLYSHGQIAKVETLMAKASYDKAVVDAKKAQRNYEIAQIALTNLLHVKSPIEPKTGLFINQKLPHLSTFLDKTISSYPGLNLLKAKRIQSEGLIKASKGAYYPEVFLFGDYNLYKDNSLVSKSMPDWVAGVGLSMPLISSSGRGGKLDAAYSKRLQVDFMYEDAKRKLSVLVKKTYKQAKQALEEYEGLSSSVDLGEENVRLREKSFLQGMATSLDVIDAELFLQGVKTQRLVASYEYIIALTKLLAISDQIDDFRKYEDIKPFESEVLGVVH